MEISFMEEFYDRFRCIADQCSFTCCEGWDIMVDTDTYNKWSSDKKYSEYFYKNTKIIKNSTKTEYNIRMSSHKRCPFLNEKELCNIVINFGDSYLSNTCKLFPRQENTLGELQEYSLSCACPAVVDIIQDIDGKMKFLLKTKEQTCQLCMSEGDNNLENNLENNIENNLPPAYTIRKAMILRIQDSKLTLQNKILFTFHMLLLIKDDPSLTKEIIREYQDERHLMSIAKSWSEIKINKKDSLLEQNELFLDIVQNYKKEKSYRIYLKDISEFAENLNPKDCFSKWGDYQVIFASFERLMENCIVSKIFSNCINDDIDDMIISFQMLITEYVMIKYSTFLRWMMNEMKPSDVRSEIDYYDIRDYIVIYSRIIGYNPEGMKEFWEHSFDEPIWEFWYMLLLTN